VYRHKILDTDQLKQVLTYGEQPSGVVILERCYSPRRLRDDDDEVLIDSWAQ